VTAEEIKTLPLAEKLLIMETIWEDLRDRFDHSDLPQHHRELLERRRARVRDGSARLLDWDAVKSTVGRP
jgi:putative addiction module component (TIGR02574 family)